VRAPSRAQQGSTSHTHAARPGRLRAHLAVGSAHAAAAPAAAAQPQRRQRPPQHVQRAGDRGHAAERLRQLARAEQRRQQRARARAIPAARCRTASRRSSKGTILTLLQPIKVELCNLDFNIPSILVLEKVCCTTSDHVHGPGPRACRPFTEIVRAGVLTVRARDSRRGSKGAHALVAASVASWKKNGGPDMSGTHRPADSRYSASASRPCAALSTPPPSPAPPPPSTPPVAPPPYDPLAAAGACAASPFPASAAGTGRAEAGAAPPDPPRSRAAPPRRPLAASPPAGPPWPSLPADDPPSGSVAGGAAPAAAAAGADDAPEGAASGGSCSASAMASAYRTNSRRRADSPCAASSAASGWLPNSPCARVHPWCCGRVGQAS